jgi:putative thioredoxin
MTEATLTHDVNAEQFEAAVVTASRGKLVVVDFWASWCGPCQVLGPILERVIASYQGKVTLAKINVDQNPGLSAQWRIRSIPSVKAFRNGAVVGEFVGAQPEAEVRRWLDGLLAG